MHIYVCPKVQIRRCETATIATNSDVKVAILSVAEAGNYMCGYFVCLLSIWQLGCSPRCLHYELSVYNTGVAPHYAHYLYVSPHC